jgi:hypothetical protein
MATKTLTARRRARARARDRLGKLLAVLAVGPCPFPLPCEDPSCEPHAAARFPDGSWAATCARGGAR